MKIEFNADINNIFLERLSACLFQITVGSVITINYKLKIISDIFIMIVYIHIFEVLS